MPGRQSSICSLLVAALCLVMAPGIHAHGKGGSVLSDAREVCFHTEMFLNAARIIDACTSVINAKERGRTRQAFAHFRRGDARKRRGDFYGSLQDLNEAVNLDPAQVPARLLLARFKLEAYKLEAAHGYYSQVIRLSPGNAEAHHGAGMTLRRMGKLPEALGAFTRAVELDPELWTAHVEAAKAHEEQGARDKALQSFATAIAVYREDKSTHLFRFVNHPRIERAGYWSKINRPGDAIADLTSVIREDARSFAAYTMRARIYEERGDLARAAEDYGKLIGLLPDHAVGEYYFKRARLYQITGKVEAAVLDVGEAVRLGGVQSVLKLQVFLKNNGFDEIEINGKYTVDMRRALKRCMKSPTCTKILNSPI